MQSFLSSWSNVQVSCNQLHLQKHTKRGGGESQVGEGEVVRRSLQVLSSSPWARVALWMCFDFVEAGRFLCVLGFVFEV